jgi:hypothetical protein
MNFRTSLALTILIATPSLLRADMVVTPSAGFSVTWDGNDGDNFNPASPAPVPANLSTGAGAAPFSSSDLGPELGIQFHVVANLNDGLYGNSNSWIGGNLPPGVPAPFAGVKLGGFFYVTGFAIGRDNGNGAFDDSSVGTDACGGQCDDRSLGTYKVQITRVSNPGASTPETGDAASGWQTIATLNYQSSDDTAPGGSFTSYLRHEFEIAAGVDPVLATGLRIVVPATGLGGGTAIDEIEIYGTIGADPDSDGDGFDNDVETALGFDPNNPASSPESIATSEFAVEFGFYAGKNRNYRIESSTDTQAWTTVEDNIAGTGGEIRRLYSTRGQPRKFYRASRIP